MDSVKPYNTDKDKTQEVEEMFDSIAPAYDSMNSAMSFGLHRYWRRKALDAVSEEFNSDAPQRILDVACGTGDVTFDLNNRFPQTEIVGLDLSEKMLDIARKRLAESAVPLITHRIKFEKGDCLKLAFDDNSFDLITVAYGVRNFEHLLKGIKEMTRVLRPGGRICIIELSEPTVRPIKAIYNVYSRHIIPIIGKMVSGDARAYSYLPESIAATPQRDQLADLMRQAGLSDCRWHSLTLGVITYYVGVKPKNDKNENS